STSPVPGASGTGTATGKPRPVPAEYLKDVLSAGKMCPAITPVRIAAQLMAASGFNPNALGPNGAIGIAQFRPEIWALYAQAPVTTAWSPSAAVPPLGVAMCALANQLSGLGTAPYTLAVAAFQFGSDPVRQAGQVPAAAGLREFISKVMSYAAYYAT